MVARRRPKNPQRSGYAQQRRAQDAKSNGKSVKEGIHVFPASNLGQYSGVPPEKADDLKNMLIPRLERLRDQTKGTPNHVDRHLPGQDAVTPGSYPEPERPAPGRRAELQGEHRTAPHQLARLFDSRKTASALRISCSCLVSRVSCLVSDVLLRLPAHVPLSHLRAYVDKASTSCYPPVT